MAALLASCSSQKPAGDGAPAPESQSTQHVLEKLVGSDAQTPVELEAPTPTLPPESPQPGTGVEALGAAEICPPETGPVTVLVLNNEHAVRSAAAQYAGEPILHRGTETIIFENGRVITSKVEEVSDHLNELGWSGREMQLLGSPPRRYASSGGGNWRAGSNSKQNRPPKKKRRRRRG